MERESGGLEGIRKVDNNDPGDNSGLQLDCKIVMTCFFAPNPTFHLPSGHHRPPGGDHRTLGDIRR